MIEFPKFEIEEQLNPTPFVWWGWHPNYPKWSRSCWKGANIEEARNSLDGKEETYYMALVDERTTTVIEYREPTNLEPWVNDRK